MRRHRAGPSPSRRPWFEVASLAGLLHAAASLQWALGSTWLLGTVGPWAETWHRESPRSAAVVLLALTAGKALAAVGPAVLHRRRPGGAWWRGPSWALSVVLTGYGLLNTAGAWVVLAGLVPRPAASTDVALLGHAVLWDPLFAAWGVALLVALGRSRPRQTRAPSSTVARPRRKVATTRPGSAIPR